MNVQVEIKGLGNVDFSLAPYGWVRDLKVEFCGKDDADMCEESLKNFFKDLQPEPFENINMEHLEGARLDLDDALGLYLASGEDVDYENTICVIIRPVPKSTSDSTPEEIAEFIKTL